MQRENDRENYSLQSVHKQSEYFHGRKSQIEPSITVALRTLI